MSTDRPGNANAASTVPQAAFQLESSALLAHDEHAGSQWSFPSALRIGVHRVLELRVSSVLVGIDTTARATVHAPDLITGAKVGFLHNDAWVPDLALSVDVALPLGSGLFTAGAVTPEARMLAGWALPTGFGLLLNLGCDVPKAERRSVRAVHVVNLSYTLPTAAAIVLFAETFGRTGLGDDDTHLLQVDAGALWQLTPDLQLDVYSQHGLTDEAPDLQVAVGLSARI
jgi:hypothetical protein